MKKTVCAVLAAIMIFALAACGEQAPVSPPETGSITFTDRSGTVLSEISLDEIKTLDSYKRTMEIHSSSEGDTTHAYRGARLFEIMELAGVPAAGYIGISAIGSDDYLADISMDEVLMENNVFVMYEDNGEPILTKSGDPSGMRLVLLDDTFGIRFTKYLVEIQMLSE